MPGSPENARPSTPTAPAVEAARPAAGSALRGERWLVLIGALKVVKSLFFILLGVGALRLLHRDLVAFADHWIVTVLRFAPESHFVNFVLEKVALISPHQLRVLSAAMFLYATVDMVEGVGLALEKVWAEYVTLTITAAFLPVEFYELFLQVTVFRIGLVLANVVVVLYLLWLVQAQARRRMHRHARRKARQ